MDKGMQLVSWLFAFGTAVWFCVMARRAGRTRLSWTVGGAVLGLVATTLVQGLANAVSLPVSHEAILISRIKTIAAAFVVVVVLGSIFTLGMQRWCLGWRKPRRNPPAEGAN
ncbi:MAG: hypothetical protein ACLQVX_14760 [Limisphaerales bacterium]